MTLVFSSIFRNLSTRTNVRIAFSLILFSRFIHYPEESEQLTIAHLKTCLLNEKVSELIK
jgi:hypothetical protein